MPRGGRSSDHAAGRVLNVAHSFSPAQAGMDADTPWAGQSLALSVANACMCTRGACSFNVDLYKWAMKLSPAIPSDVAVDAFELARDIRELDMRAAPYDLRELGYEPVRIETAEGKAEYVEEQRAFSARGQALRARLVAEVDQLLSLSST